jgi:preprotein translocase subunit SecA
MKAIMTKLKVPEGEPIEAGLVNRSIETAQRKVESRNFDIRKQLLEYDDVANDQRRVIYQQRNELLESDDISETIQNLIIGYVDDAVDAHVPAESTEEQWDVAALEKQLGSELGLVVDVAALLKEKPDLTSEELGERVRDMALANYKQKDALAGAEVVRHFERAIMLQSVDTHWREHLASLDHLRQGIHLRGYAQKNPKQEYKREAFELFETMLNAIKSDVVKIMMNVQVKSQQDVEAIDEAPAVSNVQYQHADYQQALAGPSGGGGVAVAAPPAAAAVAAAQPFVRAGEKVGRNDPCPCGSGKKYKHCHGRL